MNDKIYTTRFQELGYMHLSGKSMEHHWIYAGTPQAKRVLRPISDQPKGEWRIVCIDPDAGVTIPSPIGPYYVSKAELLADLDRYAKFYGATEVR
jgi:hypothetical protein